MRKVIRRTKNDYIFLCVGSTKIIADSFAPMLGTMLIQNNCPFYVYGTLKMPINAINLKSALEYIFEKHKNCKIIVVDVKISNTNCEKVEFNKGNLIVAYNSLKISVGDYNLTLSLTKQKFDNFALDQLFKSVFSAYNKLKSMDFAL